MGRLHTACMRCKKQKIKCSGHRPTCRNCERAGLECQYPRRNQKVTLMQSQLDSIESHIKNLESQLHAYKAQETAIKPSNTVTETRDAYIENLETELLQYKAREQLPPNNDEFAQGPGPHKDNSQEPETKRQGTEHIEDGEQAQAGAPDADDDVITFSPSTISKSGYYGAASGNKFDSELKTFLSGMTSSSRNRPQERHYFKDPTLESPFAGVIMLPDKNYAVSLVEKVVKFIGHEYYLFDPDKFRHEIDQAYENPKRMKPLWLCHFLITLALGEQYLNESPNNDPIGMRFYVAAMRFYKSSYEEPTLEFVQVLLLLGFYLQGLNNTNAAFSFYGLATRSSLIQGLHRHVPNLAPEETEKRKRLWWTVFVMDTIWCANLGQPVHVSVEDTDVDFVEENIYDLRDGFNCELLGYNAKLAIILCSVMRDVYRPIKGSTTPSIKIKKMLDSLKLIEEYQQRLPSRIKYDLMISDDRSTANLYLRLNQNIIIITRPLLLSLFKGLIKPTRTTKRVITACRNAAKQNIDILVNLRNNEWLSTFGYWDAQFCFASLLVLIICSFSGYHCSEVARGRDLHKHMKEAGNFTACDNEIRLIELDELLSKVSMMHLQDSDTDSLRSPASQTDVAPNSDTSQPSDDEYSAFRSNVSPNTWDILTMNLEFWGSSNPL